MADSNQLVPVEISGGSLANFAKVTASGSKGYLARFQLFGSNSGACIEGKIGAGRYGIVKDDVITDLGKEVDAIIITWRPKALQIEDGDIIADHDENSVTYQKIVELSQVKDSGCMHGPELLLWVPSQGIFCTYHMSSPTARREAEKMESLLGCAVTFRSKLIDPPKSKYKWHGPVATACSTPLDVPPIEDMQEEATKFKNPTKSGVELAGDDVDDSGRER